MRRRVLVAAAVAVLFLSATGPADEPLKSGPPVGARNRGASFPQFVVGPGTGERRCPV